MLMSLEIVFYLLVIVLFTIRFLDDINGQIFGLLIFAVAAAKSSIELPILVTYYRNRYTFTVEFMNFLKG